jgi:hypothetical protein
MSKWIPEQVRNDNEGKNTSMTTHNIKLWVNGFGEEKNPGNVLALKDPDRSGLNKKKEPCQTGWQG